MKEIDLTFRLSWKAEVLLKVLENYIECHFLKAYDCNLSVEDLDGIRIRTFPLYNNRERGICLAVDIDRAPTPRPTLLIFFAGDRICDGLFVQHNEVEQRFINAPTIDDFFESSYADRGNGFGENFIEAAEFVCNLIGDFYKRNVDGL